MGSWNKTCGLSNLPIMANESVYVWVLQRNHNRTSQCETSWLYSPVSLSFMAKYNDYGSGENCTGVGVEILMNAINANLVEMPQGANAYHDIAVAKDNFDIDLFFSAVQEGRLYIDWEGKRQLDFVMMREDVVNHILENHSIEVYCGTNKGNTGYDNAYKVIKFQDVLNDLSALLDKFRSEDLVPGITGVMKNSFKIEAALRASWQEQNHAGIYLYHVDNRSLTGWFNMKEFIIDNMDNHALLLTVLTNILKFSWINQFMTATRKTWMPGGHEGSQDFDLDPYRSLMSAISAAMDNIDKLYQEEEE